jgi:WD40-like Beta Propeller Repeat
MRIIRNLLILCALMCGLLFAARQAGAGMGKGDVLSYTTCPHFYDHRCTANLLDLRTMIKVRFGPQGTYCVLPTENSVYLMVAHVNNEQSIYEWNKIGFHRIGDFGSHIFYLIHDEPNRRFLVVRNLYGYWRLLVWDGVQWSEFIPPQYGYPTEPVWTADARFAFVSTENNDGRLYVSDGATSTSLGEYTNNRYYAPQPTWSTDGRLAFSSDRTGNNEIYIWDGKALTNISQHVGDDDEPAWSTDGRLAFSSDRSGNKEIYIWDGTTLTNISQTLEDDIKPVWNEAGQLAFVSGGNKVSILGRKWLAPSKQNGAETYTNLRWLSDGRLLLLGEDRSLSLWDSGRTIALLTSEIIEYGDGAIAFASKRYRDDNQYELYILDGKNIVGTGLVGSGIYFEPDGKGGLLGVVCSAPHDCDLYHWKDGQARRLTNTPGINEYRPSFRP